MPAPDAGSSRLPDVVHSPTSPPSREGAPEPLFAPLLGSFHSVSFPKDENHSENGKKIPASSYRFLQSLDDEGLRQALFGASVEVGWLESEFCRVLDKIVLRCRVGG